MRVFVAGGAGYVGSRLVPELLKRNYEVVVYDLYLYGDDVLQAHPRLQQIKGDLRDVATVDRALQKCHAVIHLACISNDPSFELNPALGKSINLDAFEPFVQLAKQHHIQRFIYASSSSVYGVKDAPNVTEEMSLEPLTDYSRFKAQCEHILFQYRDNEFVTTVLRPATVCGYAPRQRLDVVVNILANLAFHTGTVKVMGGSQMRPNIHIEDMVRAYLHVLESPPKLVQGNVFNVGYHNHTVLEIGSMVKDIVGRKRQVQMLIEPSNDLRSYHISSQKIAESLGFQPLYSIEQAIEDLLCAFETGKLKDPMNNRLYYNIKTMQHAQLT